MNQEGVNRKSDLEKRKENEYIGSSILSSEESLNEISSSKRFHHDDLDSVSQGSTDAREFVPVFEIFQQSPSLRNQTIRWAYMSEEEYKEIFRIYRQDNGIEDPPHREPHVDLKQGPHVTGKEIGEAAVNKYNQDKGEKYVFWKTTSTLWRAEQGRFHFNFLAKHESKEPEYFFGDVGCVGSDYEVFSCEIMNGIYIPGFEDFPDLHYVRYPLEISCCKCCETVAE